jgi:hypothetical protein
MVILVALYLVYAGTIPASAGWLIGGAVVVDSSIRASSQSDWQHTNIAGK